MYHVHSMLNIYNLVLVILGRVKHNVYANHTLCLMLSRHSESKIFTRKEMSSSLSVTITCGRSDEMLLKPISSQLNTAAPCGLDCGQSILKVVLLYSQEQEHWRFASSGVSWMHRCLSGIGSSEQTMLSNDAVGKCFSEEVVSSSHATLSKSVKYCSVSHVSVWQ